MNQNNLRLLLLFLAAALLILLGRCSAPTCKDPEPCPKCPDCELERAIVDQDVPMTPILNKWENPWSPE